MFSTILILRVRSLLFDFIYLPEDEPSIEPDCISIMF
jgi:hypothetical protein